MDKKNLVCEFIEEYNLEIYQDDRFFKYGIDSVELTTFIYELEKNNNLKDKKIIDLCSGTGIIGLILERRLGFTNIDFVEKQEYFSKINELNAKNNIQKYNIYNLDLKNLSEDKKFFEKYNYITINPPYKKDNSGLDSGTIEKTIAKKEDKNFIENFFKTSKFILKDNGRIYMVHRPERIVDLFEIARKYNIEPKIIQYLVNNKDEIKLVLIQFVKNAGNFLKVLPIKRI